MIPQKEFVTREEQTLIIPAGKTEQMSINGDYVYIDSITAPIKMGINATKKLGSVRVGTTHQGSPNKGLIKFLVFQNDTGAPCTVSVIYGFGVFSNPANVTVQNPSFTLSADDIDAIRGLPQVLTPALLISTGVTVIAAGKKQISVANTGSTNITVGGTVLEPNRSVSWSAPGRFDTFAAITVDATGGSALIATLT